MSDRLLISNARILTQDPRNPVVAGMSVANGRIERLYAAAADLPMSDGELIDCGGATVIPGFVDAHCHPLALGAHLAAIDCSPSAAPSIPALVERIRSGVKDPNSGWVRAVGYDELLLEEQRHPTHLDLDQAFDSAPVMLTHSSGHAVVLNSIAMAEIGLGMGTEEPPGGTIDRDVSTGEPTGLLLEMSDWLSARLPAASRDERLQRLGRAAEELLAAGVTSVTDAGHRNDAARLSLYGEASGTSFPLRTTVMLKPGVARDEMESTARLRPGLTKLMVTTSGGQLHPGPTEIKELVEREMATGSPGVAIHAVEQEAVIAAAEAFRAAGQAAEKTGFVRRIEHAAEAPPEVVAAIAESGATVVAQPGFIWSRGDRYLAAAEAGGPGAENLYPLRSLIDAGVPVLAGSDAPYGTWRPLEILSAALERRSNTGHVVGPSQAIKGREALGLFGGGVLCDGAIADFVLLSDDPLRREGSGIAETEVIATYVGGEMVWVAGKA